MSAKKKVQKQMEFYLSKSNLRQDKFLQQQMQLDEESFIHLDVFLSFNRIKSLGANMRMLVEAIKKSTLMTLNEAETHVRPNEIPDDENDDSIEKTVYIENFPCGCDHDSLRRLFAPFGKVNLVSMPRFQGSKKFKGFAFIEFSDVISVEKVLDALKSNDLYPDLCGIKGMAKSKWMQLRENLMERMSQSTKHNTSGTLKQAVDAAATTGSLSKDFFTPGLLIRLSNIPSETPRKEIKAKIDEAAPVAFLDDSKLKFGGDVAYARFLSTSHTERVMSFFQNAPLHIKDSEIHFEVMRGEDEELYWTNLVNAAGNADNEAVKTNSNAESGSEVKSKTSHIHFSDDEKQVKSKRQKRDD